MFTSSHAAACDGQLPVRCPATEQPSNATLVVSLTYVYTEYKTQVVDGIMDLGEAIDWFERFCKRGMVKGSEIQRHINQKQFLYSYREIDPKGNALREEQAKCHGAASATDSAKCRHDHFPHFMLTYSFS